MGDAGLTLYRVGSVKRIEGVRTYVAVDGGMGDNPRYTMYGSPYDMVVANKASQPKDTVVTVAGRYCETDLLQEHIPLQTAAPGDVLAVLATGAYNYSMASNYNRVPRPPLAVSYTHLKKLRSSAAWSKARSMCCSTRRTRKSTTRW